MQFILGQGLTCNFFPPEEKVVVRVALSILAKSEQCDDREPEPHTFFTAVLVQSGYARVESRYFDVTAGYPGYHVP